MSNFIKQKKQQREVNEKMIRDYAVIKFDELNKRGDNLERNIFTKYFAFNKSKLEGIRKEAQIWAYIFKSFIK